MRLRRQDDANFTNRTRFLARRVEEMGRPVTAPQRGVATTGEEFLATLVDASKRGPIANLVVYGHAASTALFAREDRGFYASVMEVAKGLARRLRRGHRQGRAAARSPARATCRISNGCSRAARSASPPIR